GETKKLLADNIKFQGTDRSGVVWLNVDGYDRAFVYQADLSATTGTTPFTPIRETALRAPDGYPKDKGIILYSAPTPKFPLRLEVDTAQAGAKPGVRPDRKKDGGFDATETINLPTSKEQKLWSSPDFPDGGFLFKTSINDWVVPLNSDGLLGDHRLQIRLIDAGGA